MSTRKLPDYDQLAGPGMTRRWRVAVSLAVGVVATVLVLGTFRVLVPAPGPTAAMLPTAALSSRRVGEQPAPWTPVLPTLQSAETVRPAVAAPPPPAPTMPVPTVAAPVVVLEVPELPPLPLVLPALAPLPPLRVPPPEPVPPPRPKPAPALPDFAPVWPAPPAN